jgi:hypothetical protein
MCLPCGPLNLGPRGNMLGLSGSAACCDHCMAGAGIAENMEPENASHIGNPVACEDKYWRDRV